MSSHLLTYPSLLLVVWQWDTIHAIWAFFTVDLNFWLDWYSSSEFLSSFLIGRSFKNENHDMNLVETHHASKKAQIAWIVSHCHTTSNREGYVKRLQDISKPDYSTPYFNPWLFNWRVFNPRFFYHELFSHSIFNLPGLKFRVEKFLGWNGLILVGSRTFQAQIFQIQVWKKIMVEGVNLEKSGVKKLGRSLGWEMFCNLVKSLQNYMPVDIYGDCGPYR